MYIGFLANHRLCMHPQDELVRIYQYLFTSFQNLFLSTLYTLRYFQNNSESLIIEVILHEVQYACGYICLLLEKHMALRVQTIS